MRERTDATPPDTLDPERAERLADFARACRAAARAVVLYPPAHPAITVALGRLTDLTARITADGPLVVSVLPDGLLVDGRGSARAETAVVELAGLLHAHAIGALTVAPGIDADGWRRFLELLGQAPDAVRGEGGIARAWTTAGGRGVELTEIDYAEVLREKVAGEEAGWAAIVTACLEGRTPLESDALRAILDAPGGAARLGALAARLDRRADGAGEAAGRVPALRRLLAGLAELAPGDAPAPDTVAAGVGAVLDALPPDLVVSLIDGPQEEEAPAAEVVTPVIGHAPDAALAHVVARSVVADRSASARLVQAFRSLVPDADRRQRLVRLVRGEVEESPLGLDEDFESLWGEVADLLTSYSDTPFVGDAYGRELSIARAQAAGIDQIHDDPPEQVADWLRTVLPSAVQTLDQRLLLDLLAIEDDPGRWQALLGPVVSQVGDLLLVGDFAAAGQLVSALTAEAAATSPRHRERQPDAAEALTRLATGPMMAHIAGHLQTIDAQAFEQVKSLCLALGEVVIAPLAEALSTEERDEARRRLTDLLLAFGKTGRQAVERLRTSANPSVRRTAASLLRAFGGSEALPDLAALLDDHEPAVQREAIRAILAIGSETAYAVLARALTSGTPRSRMLLMRAVGSLRDEAPAPLLMHLVRTMDGRGDLGDVYLRAIEMLGAVGDQSSVAVLERALYRGDWWAPRRTSLQRHAAAGALARIDAADARRALEQAVEGGPRGVRAAARAQLKARA